MCPFALFLLHYNRLAAMYAPVPPDQIASKKINRITFKGVDFKPFTFNLVEQPFHS